MRVRREPAFFFRDLGAGYSGILVLNLCFFYNNNITFVLNNIDLFQICIQLVFDDLGSKEFVWEGEAPVGLWDSSHNPNVLNKKPNAKKPKELFHGKENQEYHRLPCGIN